MLKMGAIPKMEYKQKLKKKTKQNLTVFQMNNTATEKEKKKKKKKRNLRKFEHSFLTAYTQMKDQKRAAKNQTQVSRFAFHSGTG